MQKKLSVIPASWTLYEKKNLSVIFAVEKNHATPKVMKRRGYMQIWIPADTDANTELSQSKVQVRFGAIH